MKYPLLFQEGMIGTIRMKDRFIMAPMGNNYGDERTAVSTRQIAYYERRAQGGVGLIVTESAPVTPAGRHGNNRIQVYLEDSSRALSELVNRVHDHDCRIVLQLTHGGAKCAPALIGEYPVAPSSLVLPKKDYIPRSLSGLEIEAIIASFVDGARTAMTVGFDGVELLAASGHLIHQFLSPVSNRRLDEYGGSVENRARFLVAIVRRIRKATRPDFPILVKLYGKDPENPEGTALSSEDLLKIAVQLDRSGVASLHLSTNFSADPARERKELIDLASLIKQGVKARISLAGNILDPATGEEILRRGVSDYIELGRPILAEPDFADKARRGEDESIRPCLNCNHCRFETAQKRPIKCTVNPLLGREGTWPPGPTAYPKHVAIIGGGPAGMEAAIRLAEMGHGGVIYERSSELGGLLAAAGTAPGKGRIRDFSLYMQRRLAETGFRIALGQEATPENLQAGPDKPEALIVAVGAKPFVPQIAGIGRPNVYYAADILARRIRPAGRLVVLGGGQVGCEAADFLTEAGSGCEVTLMATSPGVAKNVIPQERNPLLKRLGSKGTRILIGAAPIAFDGRNLRYTHGAAEKTMDCDALIIAKGWSANGDLAQAFTSATGLPVFTVGDAAEPRSLLEALEDGLNAAERINATK